jgi:hypothetical protein
MLPLTGFACCLPWVNGEGCHCCGVCDVLEWHTLPGIQLGINVPVQ